MPDEKVTHTVYGAKDQRAADEAWTQQYRENEQRNAAAVQGHWLDEDEEDEKN